MNTDVNMCNYKNVNAYSNWSKYTVFCLHWPVHSTLTIAYSCASHIALGMLNELKPYDL